MSYASCSTDRDTSGTGSLDGDSYCGSILDPVSMGRSTDWIVVYVGRRECEIYLPRGSVSFYLVARLERSFAKLIDIHRGGIDRRFDGT